MSSQRVIGQFPDPARACEAAGVPAEHGFAVEGPTALDPPDRPDAVVLAVAPTDRHAAGLALLCAAAVRETQFSLAGEKWKPTTGSP